MDGDDAKDDSNDSTRVKVYLLQGEDWLDNGTGYCKGEVDPENGLPYFIVRSENDDSVIILKSYLTGTIQYQRQQETLIVWTDSSGKDLALSFQETLGCVTICDFLIEMQKTLCPDISLYYVNGEEITELITGPITYPPLPEVDTLAIILLLLSQASSTQFARDKITEFVIEKDYISLLITLFDEVENKTDLDSIFLLKDIIKMLILYGSAKILEDFLLSERKLLGLMGILEYNNDANETKAFHREVIKSKCFKSVIPLESSSSESNTEFTGCAEDSKVNNGDITVSKVGESQDNCLNTVESNTESKGCDEDSKTCNEDLAESKAGELEDHSSNYITPVEEPSKSIIPVEEPSKFIAPVEEPSKTVAPVEEPSKFITPVEEPSRSIIPVEDLTIFRKDFYLTYLKDVVLVKFLDDKTYSLINSMIYHNQVEIIDYLKNESVLRPLFSLYDDNDKLAEKREDGLALRREDRLRIKREGLKMLHQYVRIAKGLQIEQRSDFFSILVQSGLLKMITFALTDSDLIIRTLGTELMVIIIEQDISLVHKVDEIDDEFEIETSEKPEGKKCESDASAKTTETLPIRTKFNLSEDMNLISLLSKLLVEDENPGLKTQAFEALKMLLDPMIASDNDENGGPNDMINPNSSFSFGEPRITSISKSDNQQLELTQNYFRAFYSKVAPKLFKTLIDFSKDEPIAPSNEILCLHLCELISFCSREHEVYLSRSFILENNILLGMTRVLSNPGKPRAKLSVIQCLKHIILRDDVFYTRYIITHNILPSFFQFFKKIIDDNNLINSSCLDLLDIILNKSDSQSNSRRRDNFKLLANYIVTNHRLECELINFVDVGKKLIKLVENDFNERCSSRNSCISDDEIGKHDASTPVNEDEHEIVRESELLNRPRNLFENFIDIKKSDKSPEKSQNKRCNDFDDSEYENETTVDKLGFAGSFSGESTTIANSGKHKKMILSVRTPSESSEVSL